MKDYGRKLAEVPNRQVLFKETAAISLIKGHTSLERTLVNEVEVIVVTEIPNREASAVSSEDIDIKTLKRP